MFGAMSPMKLTFAERSALRKLVRMDGTCYQQDLKESHAERFLRAGLITRTPMRYHLTTRGQVEFLRQRYSGLRRRSIVSALKNEDSFLLLKTLDV